MNKIFLLLTAVFITLSSVSSAQTDSVFNQKLEKLDQYFAKALQDWQVPGMAIAIVKGDSIVFAKGYGVRDVKEGGTVDANTLFAVASNTKTFTATGLAKMHSEGKLSMDDQVIKHLPYFKLYDPYVTENMTVGDLLCHKSGLVTFSGDLLWYGTTHSREDVIKRAQYLQPKYGFRTSFGYSNIMFMAAGEVIEEVSGLSWDDYMKQTFLQPLNMNRSITSTNDLVNATNVASPHTKFEGEVISIPWLNWDNMAPAGSIISSVNDMSQWIRLHLNNGVYEGDTIFGSDVDWMMWQAKTPQSISPGAARLWPSTHFKAYGLGWSMFDYHGRKIVGHNGGYDGMISQMMLIPEEDMGFVILTNSLSSLYYPLMYRILDEFLSDQETDWSTMFLNYTKRNEAYDAEQKKAEEEKRAKDTKPSLELEKYTGTYHSEMYGDVVVSLKDGGLYLEMLPTPLFVGKMWHWEHDTFRTRLHNFPSLPEGNVSFVLNKKGKKVVEMKIDIPNPDFDFTEIKLLKVK